MGLICLPDVNEVAGTLEAKTTRILNKIMSEKSLKTWLENE